MPKFHVKMRIDFAGDIEAENAEEAEKLAWTSWGDTMDDEISYDGVYSIDVEEMDEEIDEDEFEFEEIQDEMEGR